MAKFTWADHSGDAGLVFQSKRTGAVVYDSAEAGLDDSCGAKYTIVCPHNRLVTVSAKKDAQFIAGSPANLGELCPACLKKDFTERELTPAEEPL
jgi:hypothetical protein